MVSPLCAAFIRFGGWCWYMSCWMMELCSAAREVGVWKCGPFKVGGSWLLFLGSCFVECLFLWIFERRTITIYLVSRLICFFEYKKHQEYTVFNVQRKLQYLCGHGGIESRLNLIHWRLRRVRFNKRIRRRAPRTLLRFDLYAVFCYVLDGNFQIGFSAVLAAVHWHFDKMLVRFWSWFFVVKVYFGRFVFTFFVTSVDVFLHFSPVSEPVCNMSFSDFECSVVSWNLLLSKIFKNYQKLTENRIAAFNNLRSFQRAWIRISGVYVV